MKKTMLKKTIVVLLFFALSFSNISVYAKEHEIRGDESSRVQMNDSDIMSVAHQYLLSAEKGWDVAPNIVKKVPLYDEEKNIIAYYIYFNTDEYMVVNNNRLNPIPIEFGESKNAIIEDVLTKQEEEKVQANILYYGPTCCVDERNKKELTERGREYYEKFKEFLLTPNEKEAKQYSSKSSGTVDELNLGYGFTIWYDMPDATFTGANLPVTSIQWGTYELEPTASGNCGRTAATNIAIYFYSQGYTNMLVNSDIQQTYDSIANYISDGPAMTIAGGLSSYASTKGYTLNYDTNLILFNFSTYKAAINNSRPVGMLLTDTTYGWHWIVGVGYREYSTGSKYARIVNGWENTSLRFYLWNQESTIISMSSYWIQ